MSLAADEQQAREIVDRVARLFSSTSSIATVGMHISTIVYDDIAFDVPIREETFSLHNLER